MITWILGFTSGVVATLIYQRLRLKLERVRIEAAYDAAYARPRSEHELTESDLT